MSVWALLVALAALAAAHTPPSEKQLRDEARIYVDALCAAKPEHCDEAKAVHDGYLDLLDKSRPCQSAGCPPARIIEHARAIVALDARTAKLPPRRNEGFDSLLRLSALCSKRLSAAAAKLKSRKTLEQLETIGWVEIEALAPKTVEQICVAGQSNCANVRNAYRQALQLREELDACSSGTCLFEKLDLIAGRADQTTTLAITGKPQKGIDSSPIFAFARVSEERSIVLLTQLVDALLGEIASSADRLESAIAAAEKGGPLDPAAMRGQAQALSERYEKASIAADRLATILGYEKAGDKRAAVNATTLRLAGLRSRALAEATKRGLRFDPGDAGGVQAGGPASDGNAQKAAAVINAASKPTLLDRRTVPLNPGSKIEAPPIKEGNPTRLQLIRNMLRGSALEKADAKRRLGRTETVGNPGAYAPFAYTQDSSVGCAVAGQVQILRAHGLLPASGNPHDQEKALIQEAEKRMFIRHDGTSPDMAGQLLLSRGMLFTKRRNASFAELEAAVRRESVLLVGVDANVLWYGKRKKDDPAGHSIIVSGGELDRDTKKMLGVYLNDSGRDPPSKGRFIPTELLKAAFQGDFAEIR